MVLLEQSSAPWFLPVLTWSLPTQHNLTFGTFHIHQSIMSKLYHDSSRHYPWSCKRVLETGLERQGQGDTQGNCRLHYSQLQLTPAPHRSSASQ